MSYFALIRPVKLEKKTKQQIARRGDTLVPQYMKLEEVYSHLSDSRQQVSLSSTLSSEINPEKPKCKCRKTNCLKFYCECFIRGGMCGTECGCTGCMNNTENLEIRNLLMVDHFEKHNWDTSKLTLNSELILAPSFKEHSHCKCSKSGCNKKYCECFRVGRSCSVLCGCKECDNGREKEGSGVQGTVQQRKRIVKRKKNGFLKALDRKVKIRSFLKRISEKEEEEEFWESKIFGQI